MRPTSLTLVQPRLRAYRCFRWKKNMSVDKQKEQKQLSYLNSTIVNDGRSVYLLSVFIVRNSTHFGIGVPVKTF